MKKAEQKESLSHSDRKFLGSPILARALFRSPKTEKKITTVSSGVQTDNPISDQSTESNVESREEENVTSKSSSCSSLNSITSNSVLPLTSSVYYVEARIKPQITVSLPLVTERGAESRLSPSDVSRTPLKPMMGVSMLSKKRLPSISGESSISVSSKSSQDGSTKEGTQLHSKFQLK
ncbi:connector enhancer of kinase suppressor of ras 2 [Caerostris extrusa]|uniref:Connector enhancer of kinase suppressor of ras 2 n=1 Tax=Caerostris extrusa TaxID=172846 RepID=A0AAV4NMS9_CAEEX|nr:connector enhancer of kinase suppressor of ras 2 [Caerostris extrusa]